MKIKTLYISCIAVIFGCICALVMMLFMPILASAETSFQNYKSGYNPRPDITDYDSLISWLSTLYSSQAGTYKFIVLAQTNNPTACTSIAWEDYDITQVDIDTTGNNNISITSTPYSRLYVQYNTYNTGNNTWGVSGGSGSFLPGPYLTPSVKLAYSNIDFTVDGVSYSVSSDPDGFFAAKDGYDITFGVYCNDNSTRIIDSDLGNVAYFTTDLYWIGFTITYNNIDYTVYPNGYMYNEFNMKTRLQNEFETDSINSTIPLFYYYASAKWASYARGICAKESSMYSLSAPLESSISTVYEGTQFSSRNKTTLRQLYKQFHALNSGITLDDLFTEITISFRGSDHTVKKNIILDYSSLTPGTFVPEDDSSEPNPFDTLENLIQNFNSYFDNLFQGDIFVAPTAKLNYEGLYDISIPDYDISTYELDAAPIAFFGSFVEWWFSTPFGLIAMAALTFLVIRTILW